MRLTAANLKWGLFLWTGNSVISSCEKNYSDTNNSLKKSSIGLFLWYNKIGVRLRNELLNLSQRRQSPRTFISYCTLLSSAVGKEHSMLQKFEISSIEEIPAVIREVLNITFSRSNTRIGILWPGTQESLSWRIRDLDPHFRFSVFPLDWFLVRFVAGPLFCGPAALR